MSECMTTSTEVQRREHVGRALIDMRYQYLFQSLSPALSPTCGTGVLFQSLLYMYSTYISLRTRICRLSPQPSSHLLSRERWAIRIPPTAASRFVTLQKQKRGKKEIPWKQGSLSESHAEIQQVQHSRVRLWESGGG